MTTVEYFELFYQNTPLLSLNDLSINLLGITNITYSPPLSPLACDMGIDMSRYFLARWQGSSYADWVPWSGFYPTLILSKLCRGSFGDIEM